MPVVSINLSEKSMAELDELKEKMGFVGRSETVRAALRHYTEDMSPGEKEGGNVEGVLLIIHEHTPRERLDRIIHDFSGLMKTQLHQHLECGKCMELFILKGEQEVVRNLVNTCRRVESIDNIRFIPTSFIEGGKCTGHGGHDLGNIRI